MVVPHLHFPGCCNSAIDLYETAFSTRAYEKITFREEGTGGAGIAHAEMRIHGQRIMLHDRFGRKNPSTDVAVKLVVTFPTADELKACYGALKEGSVTVDGLAPLPYSECGVQFIDRFGVQWAFMVE